ncbi:cytochrome P450 [Streptomyces lonarensis]|uniref:Cytochrome P450 n=1 Tax=Streptomyces lonarensis TaxID=700599 RepID=A0A7X6D146_9ACTN|nr:cytochrome P450 [Streptomyces lonarensis]NJQ06302.1 cytochrome P450 [Streptomyces lonarensis]
MNDRRLVELPESHLDAPRLGDPRYASEPAQIFTELRSRYGAVAPVLLAGDVPAWLVLGHRELQHVTADTATFTRNVARWRLGPQLPADWPLWPMLGGGEGGAALLYTEGEEHRRRSAAVAHALNGDLLEFRARCEQFAEELVESFAADGEVDLMSAYALRLPIMAVGWAMGFPPERSNELLESVTTMLSGGPDAIDAQGRLRLIGLDLVAETRRAPGNNVAGRLATHPVGLTDQQLLEDLLVVATAGHQTTGNWIGNALRLMLTDPRYTDSFARGRLPVGQALREVLWEDSPTQVSAGRWTTRPVELGNARIPAGDMLLLGLAAANSDPAIRPLGGRALRGSQAYLSYSHGPHGCPNPAREMAEAVAAAGIEVLLDSLPDLTLACAPEELRWYPGVWIRGLQQLPVTFTPSLYTGRAPDPWS